MNNMIKCLCSLAMVASICQLASAYDFEVNGIYYNVSSESNKTAEVAYCDAANSSTHTATIPLSVSFNGNLYSVSGIGDNAIDQNVEKLNLPNSIEYIGHFNGSHNLHWINAGDYPPAIFDDTFASVDKGNCTLCVGSYDEYESADYWNEFPEIWMHDKSYIYYTTTDEEIITPNPTNEVWEGRDEWASLMEPWGGSYILSNTYVEGVGCITFAGYDYRLIGDEFSGIQSLKSITLERCYEISDRAFTECSNLQSVTFGHMPTASGNPFINCPNLSSIHCLYSETPFENCNAIINGTVLLAGCSSTVIPEGVMEIGFAAFQGQRNLTSLEIPESVERIDPFALHDTGLKSVTLPSRLSVISDGLFYGSDLESVTIPEGVTEIGNRAFYGCPLSTITIPNSVVSIGDEAFAECHGLVEIYVDITDPITINSMTFDNVDKKSCCLYVPAGYSKVYESASFWNEFHNINEMPAIANGILYALNWDGMTATVCMRDDGEIYTGDIIIPSTVSFGDNYFTVTCIGERAFEMSEICSIKIPETVEKIEYGAFCDCYNLPVVDGLYYADTYVAGVADETKSSFIIREGTKWIGDYAFANKLALTSVSLPSSLTSIGYLAFQGCENLVDITIPSSVTCVRANAFTGCTGLPIENGIRYADIFLVEVVDKSMTEYLIKEDTKWIGIGAFNGCSNFREEGGLYYAGKCVVKTSNNSKTTFVVKNGTKWIASEAFGFLDFFNCLEIPDGLVSIAIESHFEIVRLYCTTPPLIEDRFYDSEAFTKIYVPYGCKEAYQNATGWNEYGNIVEMVIDADIDQYDNVLYASSAEARTSTTVTIPINMKNSVTVRDYSFSLVLPEEILPSSVTLKKSTARKEDEMSFSKAVQADGSIRVVCYSSDGQPFSGNDGEVATLTFTVPADMEVGDYPIIIKNAEISENGIAHKIPEEIISRLHIENYLPGDANMDGEVSVSDLSCIVSYLLNLEVPETFYIKAADANEDGDVSVSDLSTIVNIILYGNPEGASRARVRGEESALDIQLSAVPFIITPGEEATLSLLLSSDQDVTAFQFDAVLPDGLICINAKRSALVSEDHSFRSAALADNLTRIVCYSGSNATFAANEGTIAELTIKADKNLLPGLYTLNLNNTEVVSLNGSTKFNNQTISFEVTAPTGIETIEQESSDTPRYDLMGRRTMQSNGVLFENGKKMLK